MELLSQFGPGLAQPIARKVGVAPLAAKALRIGARQPTATIRGRWGVVLVRFVQRAVFVRDLTQSSGVVVGVAPNFGDTSNAGGAPGCLNITTNSRMTGPRCRAICSDFARYVA